jgi:uncharacterized protein YbbC (DUF1343 family)
MAPGNARPTSSRAPGVRLTKLFGPEHGIDGTAAAEHR